MSGYFKLYLTCLGTLTYVCMWVVYISDEGACFDATSEPKFYIGPLLFGTRIARTHTI